MPSSRIRAISPLDGRYANKVEIFSQIFSEYGLQRFRLGMEINWLIYLGQELCLFEMTDEEASTLNGFIHEYHNNSVLHIKKIEKITNHDVKSIEYYICEKLKENNLEKFIHWVHFALTSEDVTNIAIAGMVEEGANVVLEELKVLLEKLEDKAMYNKGIPMMSHTHGQPATPTTVGKEFLVTASKLRRDIYEIEHNQEYCAKLNGASGNYNAHNASFPDIDWIKMSEDFITEYMNFTPNPFTVQTNDYSYISELLHKFIRASAKIIELDKNMWTYISMEYFTQKTKEGEVGSSTMPHKVNPIDFENSEGNLQYAIRSMEFMATKLLETRMQRDLTDSTVLRNLGVLFGHFLIGIKSTIRGLDKVMVNKKAIDKDLLNNPQLLAEPIQTVLRTKGVQDAYERLKKFTRGEALARKDINKFIASQEELDADDMEMLLNLTTHKYIGLAEKLVDRYFDFSR